MLPEEPGCRMDGSVSLRISTPALIVWLPRTNVIASDRLIVLLPWFVGEVGIADEVVSRPRLARRIPVGMQLQRGGVDARGRNTVLGNGWASGGQRIAKLNIALEQGREVALPERVERHGGHHGACLIL